MIDTTTDDILKCKNPSVVLQQVNCLGYGSIGLMNRIMKEYPSLFKEYHELCGWFKDFKLQEEMFGTIQALPFPDSKNILCNAFSQKFYSDTRYESLPEEWEIILRKIVSQTEANFQRTGIMYEIHCPAKIGVCMKPEEIEALRDLVEEYFAESKIPFIYHT